MDPAADEGEGFRSLGPNVCIYFGGLAMLCSAVLRRRMLAIAIPDPRSGANRDVLRERPRKPDRGDRKGPASLNLLPLRLSDRGRYTVDELRGVALCALLLVLLGALLFGQRDIYT